MADFGPISGQLGYIFHRVHIALMARMTNALSDVGLTPARATALSYVANNEGCDQAALGRALGINRASTMKAVNELVALGMVERCEGRDRRSNALRLTAHGERSRLRVEDITDRTDRANFALLSEDERAVLRDILTRLIADEPQEQRESEPIRLVR